MIPSLNDNFFFFFYGDKEKRPKNEPTILICACRKLLIFIDSEFNVPTKINK